MNIIKYFDHNVIFIVPDEYKINIIKLINNQNKLYNIKVFTISEFKKKLLFSFNEQAIFYLMNNYNMSYSYAIDIINNLYYLSFDENNLKLKYFIDIKQDLNNKNLLIKDNYFLNYFNNKKCYVYGFKYLYKFDKKLLNIIDSITKLEYIDDDKAKYNHQVYSFKSINDEIEFIANDIINKINNGININNIYLSNTNKEYISTIKRIFSFYNIPINLNEKTPLYYILSSYNLINNLDKPEEYIKSIKNNEIRNKCIDILNKYYFVNNLASIKDIISEELKNNYLSSPTYKEAINIIDLKKDFINNDMEIYLIGFASEYIPVIYKDENLINDNIKPNYLEQTWELNNIEFNIWEKIINSTKNLTITFSASNLKDSLSISPLANNLNIINCFYKESNYSNISNIFNLGIMLDNYFKYGDIHDKLNLLKHNYPNTNYLTYDNKYDFINPKLIKNYLNNTINLSYSKLNIYYLCSFRYYLEHILKLNLYEDKFEPYIGRLFHYILSKIYEKDFNFDKEKNIFLENNYFDLNHYHLLFLNKMCEDLKISINHVISHYNQTLFKEIECEKNIAIKNKNENITINFNGIIDKIMKYENKVAIIDYKTNTPNNDLSLIDKGLNIQLPIYIYLIKNQFPQANIIGIYLQNINRIISNYNQKKDFEKIKKENLKLAGYTIDDENIIKEFDFTYSSSEYIKSMKLISKGFSSHTKLLNIDNFNMLYKIAENKINESANNIINAKFDINPKIVDKNNLSCEYCAYKSICFVNDSNFKYLKKDISLSFLGGNTHEMD
ncbi:MAG: PD-(D/E)XK nuclease family protein [Bacilli bacterium]|nr:PD-(D/E)XK nuclease family protein [Bacilli bacterium]MDD4407203.1 PD-(D/E)XK nuclease family protein [Bacilli bacterium]